LAFLSKRKTRSKSGFFFFISQLQHEFPNNQSDNYNADSDINPGIHIQFSTLIYNLFDQIFNYTAKQIFFKRFIHTC